jgi:hypothetical protein
VNRIKQLHRSASRPAAYYRGQEYIEDKRRIECLICAKFPFSGFVGTAPIRFNLYNAHISVEQRGTILTVVVRKRIAQRLFDDIKFLQRGEGHVVAYLISYLPTINRYLLDNRYYNGHPLSRTFSIFEALDLAVIHTNQILRLSWPIAYAPFPPSAALARNVPEVFVYDYIDAMQSYFRGEYDDCVRRIVTSAENFFRAKEWDASTRKESLLHCITRRLARKPKPNARGFGQIVRTRIDASAISGQVIRENIFFIYRVRNRIVHNGFRMSTKSDRFCSKSIATVKYLLVRYSGDHRIAMYVDLLGRQFAAQSDAFGDTWNLDVMQRRVTEVREPSSVLNTREDIENFMFKALRFNDHDKRSIDR